MLLIVYCDCLSIIVVVIITKYFYFLYGELDVYFSAGVFGSGWVFRFLTFFVLFLSIYQHPYKHEIWSLRQFYTSFKSRILFRWLRFCGFGFKGCSLTNVRAQFCCIADLALSSDASNISKFPVPLKVTKS